MSTKEKFTAEIKNAYSSKEEKSTFEKVLTSSATRQLGNTVVRELARGILGVLGLGGLTKKRK